MVGPLAFITVSRLLGPRRWGVAAVVVAAAAIVPLTSGPSPIVVIALSLLLGWAVGLATRFILGTPDHAPERISRSRWPSTAPGSAHVLRASTKHRDRSPVRRRHAAGERLRVVVFDRDLEGAGLAPPRGARCNCAPTPARRVLDARTQIEHAR